MIVTAARILTCSTKGCIFVAKENAGEEIRVVLNGSKHPVIEIGRSYSVEGIESTYTDRWARTYRQVVAREVLQHSARSLLTPWLTNLPHIGEVRASRLISAFGEGLIDVLHDPSRIAELASVIDPSRPALGMRLAGWLMSECRAMQQQDSAALAEAKFLLRLQALGVDEYRVAKTVWRLLGSADAEAKLLRNPYLLASIVKWPSADRFGRAVTSTMPAESIDPNARLIGALDSVWASLLLKGDSAIAPQGLREQLRRRGVDADAAIAAGLAAQSMGDTAGEYFRAPGAAWIEDQLAHHLRRISESATLGVGVDDDVIARLADEAQTETGLRLTDEQLDAVIRAIRSPVRIIQGGAGVGKTAVMVVICHIWEQLGGNCLLTALSGKAALQLSRGASRPDRTRCAVTIARLLRLIEASQGEEGRKEASNAEFPKLDATTLLIVDEASMVDTPLFNQLLAKMPNGCQLLLVGDHGQLPSVGFGRVFHDLVEHGVGVSTLTMILRQASESEIPGAAAAIRVGEAPRLRIFKGEREGVFLSPPPVRARRSEWSRVYEELSKMFGREHVMAIAGTRNSVEWLNEEAAARRRAENGIETSLRLGPFATVAPGDPVVCKRNRYADGLVNGLLGMVESIRETESLSVLWDGEDESRVVSPEAAADIGLAYAITCHKSQGSAAQAVIVLLEGGRLETREWLYTAVTRARSLVVVVGTDAELLAASRRRTARTTGFVVGPYDPGAISCPP